MDQKPPEILKPKPTMALVNSKMTSKAAEDDPSTDSSIHKVQRSRGYSNESRMLSSQPGIADNRLEVISLKSIQSQVQAPGILASNGKRASVEHLVSQFERATTAESPTKPKLSPIKRSSTDNNSPGMMRDRAVANDGPKQLSQIRENLKKLDASAMSPAVDLHASSPGAKVRRASELKASQVEQAVQKSQTDSANSKALVDQESDTVGNLEGKATLQRSRAINLKKRNSIKRKPSNKSTSFKEYLAKSQTRKRSGNSSVLAGSLKDASPFDKVKAMYRLYKQQTMIADEICNLYESWAKSTMEAVGKGDGKDSEDENMEEFQFDFSSLLWKDLLQASNEIINILPQTTSIKELRKVQADTEDFSRQDQSVDIFPKTEREQEAKKIGKLGRKYVTKLLAMEIVMINEFMTESNLVPILSVPNWKIEGMSQEYMNTWLQHNNIALTEHDKEKEESESHANQSTISTKVGRRTSVAQNTDKDAGLKNEVLVLAKPSHVVTKSIIEQHSGQVPTKFSHVHRIESDFKGNTICKVDFFDTDNLAYRQHFLNQEHRNYLGITEKFGELAISIKREVIAVETVVEEENESHIVKKKREINDVAFYRVLFRCKSYSSQLVHLLIPEADLNVNSRMSIFGKKDETAQLEKLYKTLISTIHPKLDIAKLKRIDVDAGEETQKIEKSLLQIDEHRTAFNYKFGLLYVRDGQTNEIQWFNNVDVSPEYERFCSIIGDTIELKGHTGFTGGLDTKNGNTGQKSIYTRWRLNPKTNTALSISGSTTELVQNDENLSFEVMYHVATLLPYFANDEQQIQRKRHIGNDLVSLVFLDSGLDSQGSRNDSDKLNESMNSFGVKQQTTPWNVKAPFDPRCIRGQFLHVYIVIQEVYVDPHVFQKYSSSSTMSLGETNLIPAYRVFTTSNVDVPTFEPSLSDPSLYPVSTPEERRKFRDFLMAKLINAENAAFLAPKFKSLNVRTFTGLMETVWKEFQDYDGKKKIRPESGQGSTSTRMPDDLPDTTKPGRLSVAGKDAARDALTGILKNRASTSSRESATAGIPEVQVVTDDQPPAASLSKRPSISMGQSPNVSPQSTLSIIQSVMKKSSKSIVQQDIVEEPVPVPAVPDLFKATVAVPAASEPGFVPDQQEPSLSQPALKVNDQTPELLSAVQQGAPKDAITPKMALKARSQRNSAITDDLASFLSEGPPPTEAVKPEASPMVSKRKSIVQTIKASISNTSQTSLHGILKNDSTESVKTLVQELTLQEKAQSDMRDRVQSERQPASSSQVSTARPKAQSVQQKRLSKPASLLADDNSDDSDDEKERKAKIRRQKQEMLDFLNSGPPESQHVPTSSKKDGTLKGGVRLGFLGGSKTEDLK